MGEISLNLVDLMEFLELRTDGCMAASKQQQAEKAFAVWQEDPTFCRRVVAILTEEGRGCANYLDYGHLVKWLRRHFPHKRILVHAHAGPGNTQDAASVEAVLTLLLFSEKDGMDHTMVPVQSFIMASMTQRLICY